MLRRPVDPDFATPLFNEGKSEDEVEKEWELYCTELEKWFDSLSTQELMPLPRNQVKLTTCMCGEPIEDGKACNACRAELTVGHEKE